MATNLTEATNIIKSFDLEIDDYVGQDDLYDISYHNTLMFPNASPQQLIHIANLMQHAADKAVFEDEVK